MANSGVQCCVCGRVCCVSQLPAGRDLHHGEPWIFCVEEAEALKPYSWRRAEILGGEAWLIQGEGVQLGRGRQRTSNSRWEDIL